MIKKIAILAVMVQSLLGFTYPDMLAQDSPFDPEMSDQASQIEEKVDGFTDRSLYIAGEAITFSMRVHTSGLKDAQDWTRILYVELLSVSGNRKAQGKFRVQDNMAIGELRIPEGLLTGDYFLRAYD